MIYVVANTQLRGKYWAESKPFSSDNKYKVLSKPNQIRGRIFNHNDVLYIIDDDTDMLVVLPVALKGCAVFYYADDEQP